MTYAMFIEKAGKPADVRGDFAPAMNRVADAGTLFINASKVLPKVLEGSDPALHITTAIQRGSNESSVPFFFVFNVHGSVRV
jgi:hypothetical protein